MLSVYKSFHQIVKYAHQRNQILQYLTGLESYISMKASKIKNQFDIGFQQPKIGLPKYMLLTSLVGINIKVYM